MGIGTWLAGMMRPLVARILVALGFQVVTITGAQVAFDAAFQLFVGHLASLPLAGFQLFLLGGGATAFGIIFGAIAFRLALWQISQSVRLLGVA